MSDIIHLLPDSIANQIAAGEVVQRPASVVKELVENAIDAGATEVKVIIKDAGRTLIQVIDNGKGMSAVDARMAFERHATSKIRKAEDLFALTTMGFRGEALPSIAAVSQIELRTRRKEDEIGTQLIISGSKVESQDVIACPTGSNFQIKNIFFNIPARRKFLKSNDTEKRNILTELERIAFVNPEVEFSFVDNDIEAFRYPISGLRQRIVNIVGKSINQQLIGLDVETSLVKVKGFIGKPESARKSRAMQYFFVNNRYMRHPYFNKAILSAFEPIILSNEAPNYFIYLEVDPSTIDVNIHPTKTEIKFENEQPIWQILFAAVKEALGKFNEVPSIDFDTDGAIDIPIHDPSKNVGQPQLNLNPSYNPFKYQSTNNNLGNSYQRPPRTDWEEFYKGFESEKEEKNIFSNSITDDSLFSSNKDISDSVDDYLQDALIHYQYKSKYILTSVKSGLMIIDQHRAHVRILFDQFLMQIRQNKGVSQRTLFPEIIELTPSEAAMIPYLMDDLDAVGFDLGNLGNNSFAINGVPSEIANVNSSQLVHDMIMKSIESGCDVKDELQESIALSMANAAAIRYGHRMSLDEMEHIVGLLFASSSHKFTPDGKPIISLLTDEVIDKMF